MSFQVAHNIDTVRFVAGDFVRLNDIEEFCDQYLSPAELAEQYREMEDAPPDDDPAQYAYAVWDAVNKRWVDV